MISLYESILNGAQLTESIFTVANSSSTEKSVNTALIENMKNEIFPDVIHIWGRERDSSAVCWAPGGFEKNLSITNDGILTLSKMKRPKLVHVDINLINHGKEILDKNAIAGIDFIPTRAGSLSHTKYTPLTLFVPQNIDMKTPHGPFEIINAKCLFTDYTIKSDYKTKGTNKDLGCIKNLKLSSSSEGVNGIYVYNHMFDSCDLGRCNMIFFGTTWDSIRPTVLLKNSKVNASKVNIYISEINDIKIFQEWKDYLMDENGIRKDLLKRLGFGNINLESFKISIRYKPQNKIIQIITDGDEAHMDLYKKIDEYHISGISRKICLYKKG